MKCVAIGDIMLSRFIGEKYNNNVNDILDDKVKKQLTTSDFIIANLESPISDKVNTEYDHMLFKACSKLLSQLQFINCFSLSNNHINDCGTSGMDETVHYLNQYNIAWTGIFKDEYVPYLIEQDTVKIAVITCTDMINEEFTANCPWKILKIDDEILNEKILEYKEKGYFVILYAHVGLLFTRFPNPPIRKLLHEKMDLGVDVAITVHPHVLGGYEYYNKKPIFYSLGDFIMDGSSFRRRRAAMLELEIDNNVLVKWSLVPTVITKDLKTILPSERIKNKILKSWDYVSKQLNKNRNDYGTVFPKFYKKEMYYHSISTLLFLLSTKGIWRTIKLVILRKDDVKMVKKWTVSDRSQLRRDDDAIDKGRKRITINDIS